MRLLSLYNWDRLYASYSFFFSLLLVVIVIFNNNKNKSDWVLKF